MNVKSAFLLAKDVIPLMEKRGFVDLLVLLLFEWILKGQYHLQSFFLFISSPKYAKRFYKLTTILRVQHTFRYI